MTLKAIEIYGARSNNLKGIDCTIVRNAITIITGLSGSGKSTLAFDTLFAEGQRRFVESLSAYARQFLQTMARPQVDSIENIPPAIAIEQRNKIRNARSTVGTITEIHDYLRLLFAKIGHLYCPDCGVRVERDTPNSVLDVLLEKREGKHCYILIETAHEDPSFLRERFLQDGFRRLLVKEKNKQYAIRSLEDDNLSDLAWVGVVVDRMEILPEKKARLSEGIELGFMKGEGKLKIYFPDLAKKESFLEFNRNLQCNQCRRKFQELRPVQFSFNSPLGACPECQGFGRIVGVDFDRVIPDDSQTLIGGAIDPFTKPAYKDGQEDLIKACRKFKIPVNKPWKDLNAAQKNFIRKGKGSWYGVNGYFEWLESKRYKPHVRIFLARYRGYSTCPVCKGDRFRPESLGVFVKGKNITDVCRLPVSQLLEWFSQIEFSAEEKIIGAAVIKEIRSRLTFLRDVGLGYLTLARQARTLSGGESQRIALASSLGASLTDTLYVLDEPSIGLHPRDNMRLIKILGSLRNLGNTIVVVEHDPGIIAHADQIIDMGPEAGHRGGDIVYAGDYKGLFDSKESLTAKYLQTGILNHEKSERKNAKNWLTINGAKIHNLKGIDLKIPLGVVTAITGVSGAGKSSLIHNILFANYQGFRNRKKEVESGEVRSMAGFEHFEDMVLMDQSPVGKSQRSNVATYMGVWGEIRKLFARTKSARRYGFSPGAFSFNVPGGRCETCTGAGVLTVDMQFLEDVHVPCEACGGKRFSPKVLGVYYQKKNIVDILNLTVQEAALFFFDQGEIRKHLEILADVGLNYLTLGQPTNTLSGGESQRLKLASTMGQDHKIRKPMGSKPMVFLFDEPTTGLHLYDIEKLLLTYRKLNANGHSLIIIEHNLDLIAQCDWVIDLGPEGGERGGQVVEQGTPETIMKCLDSYTGKYLRQYLSKGIHS